MERSCTDSVGTATSPAARTTGSGRSRWCLTPLWPHVRPARRHSGASASASPVRWSSPPVSRSPLRSCRIGIATRSEAAGAAVLGAGVGGHDVNLMALGELRSGLARGGQDVLYIEIGTGIGAGLVSGEPEPAGALARTPSAVSAVSRPTVREVRPTWCPDAAVDQRGDSTNRSKGEGGSPAYPAPTVDFRSPGPPVDTMGTAPNPDRSRRGCDVGLRGSAIYSWPLPHNRLSSGRSGAGEGWAAGPS